MSFEDGWAAINLVMPRRIPRVEFSITEYHFDLMRAVTGIEVDPASRPEVKRRAAQAFVRTWNYDIFLAYRFSKEQLARKRTHMGHAAYAVDGSDFDAYVECPFQDPEEVFAFDPWETYGAIDKAEVTRKFEEHYLSQCALYPTAVNMTGIYISLITGLTYILGWDMLLTAAGMDPVRFGLLANRYASWIQQYYDALAEADVPVIYSHDDMVWTEGAIFHPEWYQKYVFPNFRRFWAPLRESGKKILFVCDGNYTRFADDVAACGNHGFWFEIFTDLGMMAEKFGNTHFLIGNADTRILLSGRREHIRAEVARCISAAKSCPGYFMAVSNHIPPNTPVESALYYNQVYEELCRR
jgi:hypothetical protein